MSHFAEVVNGKVVRVIVAEQDFINSSAVGDASNWIQTSYNTRQGVHYGVAANNEYLPDGGTALRGNYAGIGYEYNINTMFLSHQNQKIVRVGQLIYLTGPMNHLLVQCQAMQTQNLVNIMNGMKVHIKQIIKRVGF